MLRKTVADHPARPEHHAWDRQPRDAKATKSTIASERDAAELINPRVNLRSDRKAPSITGTSRLTDLLDSAEPESHGAWRNRG
jgi:hypothetical protein